MNILVIGAGVVGVSSAWYLARAGHKVTVLDRQLGPALETSFANGGQVSVSHAEPWANPGAPLKIVKWLGKEDAPLLFRPRMDWRQWWWGAQFLYECLPSRTRANTEVILGLALYSRRKLQELRSETSLAYEHQTRGILHVFSDRKELNQANARVNLLRARGCQMRRVTASEVLRLEPALSASQVHFVGGTFEPEDESGDAHLFTRELAKLCEREGVRFQFGVDVLGIDEEAGRVSGVRVLPATVAKDEEENESPRRHMLPFIPEKFLPADAVLVCGGSYSAQLLAPLGIRIPVYPVKGYSITLAASNPGAPLGCLTDEHAKIAFTRLGNRLRVAGTAEVTGYDVDITPARIAAIAARARQVFPNAGDWSKLTEWAGLRPATPGNVPVIGKTRVRHLYVNTGHGTLGWTLACGSGQAITDIIDGHAAEVQFRFT
jgi:D-amino-acid dehydrogenase